MKLPNLRRPLYGVGEYNRKIFLFVFLNVVAVFLVSTPENIAKIWQIKWNWIRSMKFDTVRIRFFDR